MKPVDGRGGDGGSDFEVVQGGRRRVFQFKYYPDGFPSSSFKNRRTSITKSFTKAMKNPPYEWILVVPCNLTPTEDDFVQGLARGGVRVRVMGRAELDSRLAAFPDLHAYASRSPSADATKTFIQSTIVPSTAAEVGTRVRDLGRVIDTADDNWTFDFERHGDTITRHLRAKHPRAHEVSPIHITVQGRWDLAESATTAAFRRAFAFGFPEHITLPPDLVEKFEIQGPDWLAESREHVEVSWIPETPVPQPDTTVELRFLNSDGTAMAIFDGQVEHHGVGTHGRSLVLRFANIATLSIAVPHDDQPHALRLRSDFAGAMPAAALPVFDLDAHLHSGRTFELAINGEPIGTGTAECLRTPDQATRIAQLRAFVEDLVFLQQHFNRHFPIPRATTLQERIDARTARMILEGRCVHMPELRSVTATLTGLDDEVIRGLLTPGPHCLRADNSIYTIDVAGRTLEIGRVRMFHPQLTPHGHEEALQALDEGRGAGARVEFVPHNDEPFRIYMPDRWPDDQMPLTVTPLELPGPMTAAG